MRESNLTDRDIKRLWRNKTYRDTQMVLCLSQLEGCEYWEMRDRVEKLGLIGVGECCDYRPSKEERASKSKPWRAWGKDEVKEVFRLRGKGYSAKEIATMLDRSANAVNFCVDKYKDEFGIKKGELKEEKREEYGKDSESV